LTYVEALQPGSCPYVPMSVGAEPVFLIRPHPWAPILSEAKDAVHLIEDLVKAVTSKNFAPNEEDVRLLREAGFVSLWFWEKYIAGYSGPYNEINKDLHLDMCNFRQSDSCMNPGAMAAMFVQRGAFKSTIATHGADSWEILRYPDIRLTIVNAVEDRAQTFLRSVRQTFDSNELVGALYGEYVPAKNAPRWNETEIVIPCRTRNYPDATARALGATGHAEGSHNDLLDLDDVIGLEELDSGHKINASMDGKKKWFQTNVNALRQDLVVSRVNLKGTRYALDDTYSIPIEDCRKFHQQKLDGFREKEGGNWEVYYRLAKEDGKSVFPERYPLKKLEEIAETDWWYYITQLMNNPQDSGLAEFYMYETRKCVLFQHSKYGFVVRKVDEEGNFDGGTGLRDALEKERWVLLQNCDVIMAVDPAGSDTGISAKASKSAVVTWAKDWKGNFYMLKRKVGYFDVLELFDAIFEMVRFFGGHVRKCVVEANAMQKVLKPLLDQERLRRGVYVYFEGVPATIDKDVRIRNNVGLALASGKVWLNEGEGAEFLEEKNIFPQSKYKKDVLDASEKALVTLRTPDEPENKTIIIEFDDEDEAEYVEGRNRITGY